MDSLDQKIDEIFKNMNRGFLKESEVCNSLMDENITREDIENKLIDYVIKNKKKYSLKMGIRDTYYVKKHSLALKPREITKDIKNYRVMFQNIYPILIDKLKKDGILHSKEGVTEEYILDFATRYVTFFKQELRSFKEYSIKELRDTAIKMIGAIVQIGYK